VDRDEGLKERLEKRFTEIEKKDTLSKEKREVDNCGL
jgi:hypothetical protein